MRRLWVLGDSWADPSPFPWTPDRGWPQAVATRLGLALVNSAVGGAGYTAPGAPTFPVQAARGTGAGADAVIVWGSLNDPYQRLPADAVHTAAVSTYRLLRAACPSAPLLVFGPQWTHIDFPSTFDEARDAVQRAAHAAGALFVDPSRWLRGRPELVWDDDLHPNADGHDLLADLIAPELLWALGPERQETVPRWDGGYPLPLLAPYTSEPEPAAATPPSPPIGCPP